MVYEIIEFDYVLTGEIFHIKIAPLFYHNTDHNNFTAKFKVFIDLDEFELRAADNIWRVYGRFPVRLFPAIKQKIMNTIKNENKK